MTWGEMCCELCRRYGWTLEYVGSLSFDQIEVALSGGKARKGWMPINGQADLERAMSYRERKEWEYLR